MSQRITILLFIGIQENWDTQVPILISFYYDLTPFRKKGIQKYTFK